MARRTGRHKPGTDATAMAPPGMKWNCLYCGHRFWLPKPDDFQCPICKNPKPPVFVLFDMREGDFHGVFTTLGKAQDYAERSDDSPEIAWISDVSHQTGLQNVTGDSKVRTWTIEEVELDDNPY